MKNFAVALLACWLVFVAGPVKAQNSDTIVSGVIWEAFQTTAEHGDAESQFTVGQTYFLGRGGESQNYAEAAK